MKLEVVGVLAPEPNVSSDERRVFAMTAYAGAQRKLIEEQAQMALETLVALAIRSNDAIVAQRAERLTALVGAHKMFSYEEVTDGRDDGDT